MIRARALATTLALLLSACGTGGESPFALALTGMAASLGQSSAKARGEAALARQLTPAALARATGVDVILHGHTHRPGVHEFELDGRRVRRIVLDAWYERGSALRWDEHGFTNLVLPFAAA